MIKPIFEFLMWENCRNKCSFCFQQEKNQLTDIQKTESMLAVKRFIKYDDRFIKGSHVLLVGGELFDSPSIFTPLANFLSFIVDKMNDGTIDLLYINTNLIYKNMDGLYYLLDLIDQYKLFDRLKFTTSYDLAGRFASPKTKFLMLSNLDALSTKYPDIKIVVNSMLSKQMCEAILSGEYKLDSFMKMHHCDVNLIPYIVYDKELAPTRELVFKALMVADRQCPGYLKRYIANFDLPQAKELYQYRDGRLNYVTCPNNACGHSENFVRYSDKGTCFICDLKRLFGE